MRVAITRDQALHTWEGHPKRDEYLAANDGLGACNTGSGKRLICCMGGIGCDVDHVRIARAKLICSRSVAGGAA